MLANCRRYSRIIILETWLSFNEQSTNKAHRLQAGRQRDSNSTITWRQPHELTITEEIALKMENLKGCWKCDFFCAVWLWKLLLVKKWKYILCAEHKVYFDVTIPCKNKEYDNALSIWTDEISWREKTK